MQLQGMHLDANSLTYISMCSVCIIIRDNQVCVSPKANFMHVVVNAILAQLFSRQCIYE
jgi:hypothetical protein